MLKVRVVRSETAMTDVLREVSNFVKVVFPCIILVTLLCCYGVCKVLWECSCVSFEDIINTT